MPCTRGLDRARLWNHLPQILDGIAEMVKDGEEGREIRSPGRELDAHAVERLDQGYDLESVVAEYAVLRECIFGLRGDAGVEAQSTAILNRAIDDAIGASVERFTRTHQRSLIALDRLFAVHERSGDLESLLDTLTQTFLETTEAVDSIAIFLREGERLRVRAAIGLNGAADRSFSLGIGEGFAGRIAKERTSLQIRDGATNPVVINPLLRRSGTRALYGVPMTIGDRLLGVAHIGSRTAYEFSEEDKVLFRVLVERITGIIHQQQLVARVNDVREQVEHSHSVLNALISSVPIGLAYFDRELRYQHLNETLAALNGRSVEEHINRTIREILPNDADLLERLLHRLMETGERVTRLEFTRPGASDPTVPRHWLFDAFPVYASDGAVVGAGCALIDITERKLAEEATKRSEARFRSLVLASSQIVWTTNAQGMPEDDSPSFRTYTGMSREVYFEGNAWNCIHPDERAAAVEQWRGAIESRTPFQIDARMRRFDGAYRHFLIRVVPVVDDESRIVEWVGTCTDIHDQKKAQLALAKRAAELEAVIASIPDAAYVGDERGVRAANAPALSMLGLERLEELNEQFDRVAAQMVPIAGDAGPTPLNRLFDHAFDGNSTVRELRVHNERTGEAREVRSAAAPIRLSDGAIIGAVTVNTDITEQKEAAERVAFLDEAMKVLSSSLDDRVILERLAALSVPRLADWCIIDLLTGAGDELERVAITHIDSGKVALVDEWRRRFPLRKGENMGTVQVLNTGKARLVPEFTPDQLRAAARNEDHLRLLQELQLNALLTVPLITRDESIGTLTLCMAESGRRYDEGDLAFAEELARRASLAVDNARLYREAQDAIRARDELLSIAAHDLRSPLASLSLQLQTVLRKAGTAAADVPSDWIRPKLEMMGHQLSRVSVMLEDLLDVSRIHAGRMRLEIEEIDLAALVRDVLSRFEEAIQTAGCTLTTRISPELMGRWDRLRLEQVVTNLVSNAIKYGRQSPIEVTLTRLDHAARLTVRDRGVGIAPEHHDSIFRRFERAGDQSAYQGTGLGLWIVRRIVEAMHGTTRVESELGQGSKFIVDLPLRC